jgi:hypothetical protein
MPGDQTLLMCRRNDFSDSGDSTPYRILEVDVATGAPTFLTPLDPAYSDIGPALRDDGSMLFWRQEFQSGKSVQSLMQMNGDGSALSYLLTGSTSPRTSRDGTKVLFRWGNWHTLGVAPSHDLSKATTVLAGSQNVYEFDFSPDLTQAVYSIGRIGQNCNDVYVIKLDGTGKTRIVDCVADKKSPSGLQWVQAQ